MPATDSQTALYRYYDNADRPLYIGITDSLGGRERGHARSSIWMQFVARSSVERYLDREDALVAEREAIETEHPLFNRQYNFTAAARERLKAYLEEIGRMDLYDPRRFAGNMPLGELEMRRSRPRTRPAPGPGPAQNETVKTRPVSRDEVVLMCIAALQDDRLSLAARGLLALVVSLPSRETTTEWLASHGPDSEEVIQGALAELEICGYFRDGVISDAPRKDAAVA